jgi:hypothetical protein
MKCPFSGKLCRNCSLYIGRHYFLCYQSRYQGYIKNAKRGDVDKVAGIEKQRNLDVPKRKYDKSLDPYAREI